MRTIGVVTVGRSDWGIYRPVLERIREDDDLRLRLFVGGMHLSERYGSTVSEIERDGWEIAARVPSLPDGDEPVDVAHAMAAGTAGFADAFRRERVDVLVVLGDRFEMFAAAAAALPFVIPLAHVHGGESTEGQIDEPIRHSLTKLSHLHFASMEIYARRIVQMGEEPWRVTVSGAPGLDAIRTTRLLDDDELRRRTGIDAATQPLLVTYHPVTLAWQDVERQTTELLAALAEVDLPLVFTQPNADTANRVVARLIDEFVASSPRASFVANLGSEAYFTLMSGARAMVGNSSSGIIEAASFGLPVVNVGQRQRGRVRGENVLDAPDERDRIVEAIRRATAPEFRRPLVGMTNPYGDGHAADRIVERLRDVELGPELVAKRFHDLPGC